MYADLETDRRRITEISPQQIVFSDSTFDAAAPQPSPAFMFKATRDSARPIPPETALVEQRFDWSYYLSHVPFTFEWSDSTKLDSVRFIYSIDKNGNATCKPLPWRNGDSVTKLGEKAQPYLFLLDKWSPAKRMKKRKGHRQGKTKNAACTVILTIYAYDPYAGRLMPIEISGK
jgi:hypothetical protein